MVTGELCLGNFFSEGRSIRKYTLLAKCGILLVLNWECLWSFYNDIRLEYLLSQNLMTLVWKDNTHSVPVILRDNL
jgi:hypothetical protein